MRITKQDIKQIIKEEIENDPDILRMLKGQRKFAGVEDDDDGDLVEAGKKKKKWCGVGQKYHGLDGKWVDPDKEAGSSSESATGADCKTGKAARPNASRQERFTKLGCGRGEQHRCKDGSKKWGKGAIRKEGEYQVKTKAQDKRDKERESLSKERKRSWLNSAGRQLALGITESDIDEAVRTETLDYLNQMKEDRIQDPKKFKARCRALGLQSYEDFLNAVDRLSRSQKGDLHKPKKENANILDVRKIRKNTTSSR